MMEPYRLTLSAGGFYLPVPHEGEEVGCMLKSTIKIHIGKRSTAQKGRSHIQHYGEATSLTSTMPFQNENNILGRLSCHTN